MNEKNINKISVVLTSFFGVVLLSGFLFSNPTSELVESLPGMDNRPADMSSSSEIINFGTIYTSSDGIASEISGSWTRFRGDDFSNISTESTKLTDTFDADGPDLLWSVDLGEGHSGPVISNGRVYLLDYDEERRADILRCFSLDDGKEIWRQGYEVFIKRNHGMSRTVPAVSGNYVVSIGPKCHVMCVDAVTGELKWGLDIEKEYESEIPLWYTGQCVLIDNGLVILAVGGTSLIVAVDLETGEKVWEIPNPNGWKMSHASVIPFTIHGKDMYVYAALGGIVGFSRDPDEKGRVLFETNLWDKNVVAPSAVYLDGGKLFMTSGYGAGSTMLNIKEVNGGYEVEEVQVIKPGEGIASEQQTPIYYDGKLFAILPKDAGPLRNQFVCYDPSDISKLVWSSGKTHRFGLGPYLLADNKFFILSDEGVLTVMKASTTEAVILAESKILDGHDAWGPMAVVDGRLLARDSRRMVCVDVRSKN